MAPNPDFRSAAEHGLMTGPPPYPPERLVSLANWQDPPFSRWGFQHIRDLIPTARVPRGDGPVWELPRAERDLSGIRVPWAGGDAELEAFLTETYTDGLLVLHRGRIVHEEYRNGMGPASTHLLMSVSKSVVSAVCGVLVGEGRLSPADLVTTHLPELAGTSWDGCTVRHLLDMRAGTRFDEDYANLDADVRVYEQIYQWRPRIDPSLPADVTAYYPTLVNDGPHGGPFRYRSILTDVLGWVMERAGGDRLANLVSSRLWAPMGAEVDADFTVDGHANAMADAGLCVSLRDLGRFGLLMASGGRCNGRQVVPEAWIRDTLTPDPDSRDAYLASDPDPEQRAHGSYYRNQFWVFDAAAPIWRCSGINGQHVVIHGPAEVVIAKLSTWPVAMADDLSIGTRTALLALAEAVAG
ncbi:MAG TPA: serine hydrolase [Candidatus Limnocylindrales bacterium]